MIKLVDNIFPIQTPKAQPQEWRVEKINALYKLINQFKKQNEPLTKKKGK